MDITEHNIFDITAHVMGVLDEWNLQTGQIIRLLGLEGQAKSRDLRKFRSKSKSFPFSADIVERIEHISGIVEALQTTHPFFPQSRLMWLNQPHNRFNKATPLSVMLADGLEGLVRVRIEIDCAYGWSLSDHKAKS